MNEHLFFGEQGMESGWLCDCRARFYFPSAVKQSLPLFPPCGRPIPSCLHSGLWQGCCIPVTSPHLPLNPLPRPPVPSFGVFPNSSGVVYSLRYVCRAYYLALSRARHTPDFEFWFLKHISHLPQNLCPRNRGCVWPIFAPVEVGNIAE